MPQPNPYFLSCDWGTTNFRLRLIAREGLRVLAEAGSDQGVSALAKAWKEKGEGNEEARVRFYTDVLRAGVAKIREQAGEGAEGTPVVISGMASSTLGLANLPYQSLPVPTDGSGFKTQQFPAEKDFPHNVLLISGLCTDDDVMRGEETQIIGCLTPEMEGSEEVLIIHPGTHAKHVTVRAGQITGFKTYMTGELFKLFSTHGILRDNVAANDFTDAARAPFEQGVKDAQKAPLLHAVFRVRTADLFGNLSKEEAYHYLSGLLIGTELQVLAEQKGRTYLCSGPALHGPYSTALRVLGLDKKVEVFPPEWEEGAVVRGQAKVLAGLSQL